MEKSSNTAVILNETKSTEKARSIIERLFRESKEARENAVKEYQENPELREFFDEIEQKQKEADAKQK